MEITFTYKDNQYSIDVDMLYLFGACVLPDGTILAVETWDNQDPVSMVEIAETDRYFPKAVIVRA